MICKRPHFPFFCFKSRDPPLKKTMKNEIFPGLLGHKSNAKGTLLIKAGESSTFLGMDRGESKENQHKILGVQPASVSPEVSYPVFASQDILL